VLILIVAGGPDKGRVYELTDDKEVVLGREGTPVALSDRKSSRRHARLWSEGGAWHLEDLGSRHGTHRNHKLIDGPTVLKDGDYVQIGNTVLVLSRVSAEQAERMALVGAPQLTPTVDAAPASGRRSASRSTGNGRLTPATLTAAGAAIAAAVAIAINVVVMMSAGDTTERLRADVSAGFEQQHASQTAIRDEIDSRLKAAGLEPDDGHRTDVLARLDTLANQQQQVADGQNAIKSAVDAGHRDVIAAIDAQPDHGDALAALKAAIDARPDPMPALAELHEAIEAQGQVGPQLAALTDAIAAHGGRFDPIQQTLQRHAELASAHAKALGEMQSTLADVGDSPDADAIAKMNGSLDKLVGLVEAQPSAEAIGEQVAAVMKARSDQTDKLFAQVLERLDAQPKPEVMLASIREAIGESDTGSAEQLDRILAELKNQPSVDQLAAALTEAVTTDGPTETELLKQIMAKVDAFDAVAERVDGLRGLVEAGDAKIEPALGELLAAVKGADETPGMVAALAELRTELEAVKAAMPEDPGDRLDAVLAKIESPEQGLTADQIKAIVADEVAPLRDAFPVGVNEKLTAALARLKKLDDLATADTQLTAAEVRAVVTEEIKAVRDAMPADPAEKLDRALARLQKLDTLDELAGADRVTAEQVASAVNEAVASLKTDAAKDADLAKAIAKLERVAADVSALGPAFEKVDTRLAALESATLDEDLAPLLKQIADAAQAQKAADDKLDQIRVMLAREPEEVEAMLQKVLVAVEAAGEDDTALRQVLKEVRNKHLVDIDDVRSIVRAEGRALSQAVEVAVARTREDDPAPYLAPVAPTTAADAASPLVMTRRPAAPGGATTDPNRAIAKIAATPDERLSDTQLGYKRAWETGRAVTVGRRTDPTTGRVIKGRTLDPTLARAAGVTSWSEWYYRDDMIDRVLLQREAAEFMQRDGGRGAIHGLPDALPVRVHALPETDDQD